MGVPIFEQPPPKYTATRILQILLDPNIDQSMIAKERPIEVERSSTFVVVLTCLKHPDDVKKRYVWTVGLQWLASGGVSMFI